MPITMEDVVQRHETIAERAVSALNSLADGVFLTTEELFEVLGVPVNKGLCTHAAMREYSQRVYGSTNSSVTGVRRVYANRKTIKKAQALIAAGKTK